MLEIIKKRYKLIIFLFVLVLLGAVIYPRITKGVSGKKKETVKVVRGTLEEKMTISGEINAEEKVTLRFQTSGRLAWVGVKEGDHVKKYQSVASLDQRELKMKLKKELNDYLTERWDFEQVKRDDYKDKVMTDTIKRLIDKAQFDVNNSVLDVEIQNLAIELSNLWTPIEGIVTRVASPYAGVNITATQAEIDVVNPKTVFFLATADQTEVVKLKEGMIGELVLDAYPDATISGIIKNISFIPKSGETGVVYSIKFLINEDNSDYRYRQGMAGDLSFTIRKEVDILYLPIKYIKEEKNNENPLTGKKYVQVKKGEKLEKIYIETGMETDEYTEIKTGLTEGEIISN